MLQSDVYLQVFNDKVTNYPAIKIHLDGAAVVVVYDANLVQGSETHGAVFVDEDALSNAIYRYPRNQRICLLQESPVRGMSNNVEKLASNFDLVLTFDARLLELGAPFSEFYYGTSWINRGRPSNLVSYAKSKLCSFVGSVAHEDIHGYPFRKEVVNWVQQNQDIDLWGKGTTPFESKDAVLSPYYFSIAMENTQQDFYFTEKLIDCFVTDTVPVYWGPPGIEKIFDTRGMLRFSSVEDLVAINKKLSTSLYQEMLPYLQKNRQIAFELMLTGHETLCHRLAAVSLKKFGDSYGAIKPIYRSKLAAGVRKLLGN